MKTFEYIRAHQKYWFDQVKPFLLSSNVNVGSGHGYFSKMAHDVGFNMTSLEVAVPEDALDQKNLVLYDGKIMPFANNFFEASIAMYVLHHTPNPEALLNEMKRVSAKRIILVEELYKHGWGKARLAFLDVNVNSKAKLKSRIYWNSYLNHKRLLKMAEANDWKVTQKVSNPKVGFDEVLWILDR